MDNLNKIINGLKNENLDLKGENELLQVENLDKNVTIAKLRSEKFILYNELNELINSLKTIDIKLLNKFYKNYSSNLTLSKNYMPSSLGIKYNIQSVQNQMTYLMHSDLKSAKAFTEYISKAKDVFSRERAKVEEETVKNNIKSNEIKFPNIENENNFIDLDKYFTILIKFEKEFEKICDKNIIRNHK